MDQQHPIPQDVTGFQFKLIGDMTVKQFVYLASGVILAWITFSLPIFWLIKYPLIFLFGIFGVALAFIPIEGRPFDVMLTNFLKALFAPNQFVFQKIGHPIFPQMSIQKKVVEKEKPGAQQEQQSAEKLQKYLKGIHTTSNNPLDQRELRFLGTLPLKQNITQAISAVQIAQPPPKQQPITQPPLSAEPEKNDMLEKEAALLSQELAVAKEEEVKQQNTPMSTVAHQKVMELEKELNDILSQKESLQDQLIILKRQLASQKQQVFSPSIAPIKQETRNVRVIQQGQGKSAGLPITPDAPNLLTGIVKDARGNTLPSILVEVKDRDGNPVRAFKTNGVGQFAAATQLSDGVYTIAFEDPLAKHTFDTVEIQATGAIISPLEIISIDQRETLRQELFKT